MAKFGDVKMVRSAFPAAIPRRGMTIPFPDARRSGANDDEVSPEQMLLEMERTDLTAAKLEELRSRIEMKIAEAKQKSHEARQKLAVAGDISGKPRRYSIVAGQIVEDPDGEYTWIQALQYLTVQMGAGQDDGTDKTLNVLNSLAEYEARTGKTGNREPTERELELRKELEEAKQETRRLEKELNNANLANFKTEVMQAINDIRKAGGNGSGNPPKPFMEQISGFVQQYNGMDDKNPIKGIISNVIKAFVGGNDRIPITQYKDAEGNLIPGLSLSPEQFLQHEQILFEERKSLREASNREKMFDSLEKLASGIGGSSVGDAIKDAVGHKRDGADSKPVQRRETDESADLASCPRCQHPLGLTAGGLLKCLNEDCGQTYDPSASEKDGS